MPKSENRKGSAFTRPGNYHIRVQGYLDESWSEMLAGLAITSGKRGDQKQVTTLVGQVRDQAELSGVLNTLYELHLPLLAVEYLNGD